MSGPRRVIVGASGSPGNLCALRYAGYLARATGATLITVHAWTPPGGEIADRQCPNAYLRRARGEDARQRLQDALAAAWGQPPAHLTITPVVERGEPGPVLTAIADQPGDVLVIGTGRRGTLARVFSGRVRRYCLAHARAPIVAIPPPAMSPHVRHSPLNWVFWHRPLTPAGTSSNRESANSFPLCATRTIFIWPADDRHHRPTTSTARGMHARPGRSEHPLR